MLNLQSLIWLIGVMQPVSAIELASHLEISFGSDIETPDKDVIQRFCMEQVRQKCLIRVDRDPDAFSLTSKGNESLSRKHRFARDKVRIYLLKQARGRRVRVTREGFITGLGGAAPPVDERPITKGTEANKIVPVVPRGQSYWPRFSKQLIMETGRSEPSRDIPYLPLLSFKDEKQLSVAAGIESSELETDFTTIGLILGISPKLVMQIHHKPERHYRSFVLKKKGGGERPIESPKVFLKVIQQFLNDYILADLPIHRCVHSYRSDHSIISNAALHTRKKFVANIDIHDFFGSVTLEQVVNHLVNTGICKRSASIVGQICCKDETLPQGAPTSPLISNSILFGFDECMDEQCSRSGLVYSRYADDITISGDTRDAVVSSILTAEILLAERHKLFLNKEKTRVASQTGQQRVTGIVVNDGVRPPRDFRRSVRAAFHNASKMRTVDWNHARRLRGYLSYLMAFPEIRRSKELQRYRDVFRELTIEQEKDFDL